MVDIQLPESVICVGDRAFKGCKNLVDENGFVIVRGTLYNYMGEETKIILPEGITRIDRHTFAQHINFPTITFPNNTIGADECSEHSDLQEIILPQNLTEIGACSFTGCSRLQEIIVPESVTEIGEHAFEGCSGLTKIVLSKGLRYISPYSFSKCSSLQEIIVPEGVIRILDHAFEECTGLTKVVLPKGLEDIGECGFSRCSGLQEMILPESVDAIRERAFEGCTGLTKMVLPERIIYIGTSIFADCSHLREVIFPQNHEVEEDYFGGCERIEKIKPMLESAWKNLSFEFQGMFISNIATCWDKQDVDLKKMMISTVRRKKTLKNHLFQMGNVAVVDMLLAEKVKLSLEEIEKHLAYTVEQNHTSATAVLMDYKNKTFTKNKQLAYEEQNELVEIGFELPTLKQLKEKWRCSVTKEGIHITGYKGTSTSETIPSQTKDGRRILSIGHKDGFDYLPLEEIVVEEGIQEIQSLCFLNCSSLNSITLPKGLKKIGGGAFCGCVSLTSITLSKGLKEVEAKAFCGCVSLTSISLPKGVKIIDWYAFSGCSSLSEISLPEGLRRIGREAFKGCGSLTTINLPKSLIEIEYGAFEKCSGLSEITLPEGLIEIGGSAFKGCKSCADTNGFIILKNILCDYIGEDTEIKLPEGLVKIARGVLKSVED